MEAAERPNERATVAAAARGSAVQHRMRPRLEGSTISDGSESLNTRMIALYSSSVMTPAETVGLEMERAVLPMPARFISFQIGPDEPSMRPKSTASRWR